MSDRLALANAIEDAGIERHKAERVASVIIDAIHDNVATKTDLVELKHALTMRGIAGLIAAGGILFAALHMWPPHTQLALNTPAATATVSADSNAPDYDKDGIPTKEGLMRRMQRMAPTH